MGEEEMVAELAAVARAGAGMVEATAATAMVVALVV
jgi:hypothetical protein